MRSPTARPFPHVARSLVQQAGDLTDAWHQSIEENDPPDAVLSPDHEGVCARERAAMPRVPLPSSVVADAPAEAVVNTAPLVALGVDVLGKSVHLLDRSGLENG